MFPVRDPNYYDWQMFKNNGGELNVIAVIMGLILCYFFLLWGIYIPLLIIDIPSDVATWIARGMAGFLNAWATLGNLQGRLYWLPIVAPAVIFMVYKITTFEF